MTVVFARYTLTRDELRLRFIANQEEDRKGLTRTYATSAALHAAVRARLHDPLLYDQAESEVTALRRVGDDTTPEP